MPNDSRVKINGTIARDLPYRMLGEPTFSGVLFFPAAHIACNLIWLCAKGKI